MRVIFRLAFFTILFYEATCLSSCKIVGTQLESTGETVSYNIGFPVIRYKYFLNGGKEYVAFCDFVSNKKIAVHSIDGAQLFVTPFDKVMEKENEKFYAFSIVNLDTFALLTKYTNKVFLINRHGELIYKKDYSKYLLESKELCSPMELDSGVLKVGISFMDINFPDNPTIEDYIESEKTGNFFPNLFIDSSFYKEPESITFGLDSLYSRFVRADEMNMEGNYSLLLRNRVLFKSSYSDSFYVFNNHYELDTVVYVDSKFYDIDTRPVKISDFLKNMNLISENFWEHGFISNFLYDGRRNLYYCFVRGKMDGNMLPFSIIAYDKNFSKLDEVKMDYKAYYPYGFVGSKGLYVEKINKNEKNIKTFTIFSCR